MHRRIGLSIVVVTFAAALSIQVAAATAATKVVYAGGPSSTKALAGKLLGKGVKALAQDQPGINAYFNQKVTINQGDSVKWTGLAANFHTVDLPTKGGQDLPLIVPGPLVTGVNDFAGSPFWFNGLVPTLGFNPKLLGRIGGSVYNGSSRIDSGLPVGPHSPNTLTVSFSKPGVYKYFCDVHADMVGYVVVRAKGKPVPTRKQDTAALVKQQTTAILAADKLTKVKQPANHVSLGLSTPQGVELYSMFPSTLTVNAGTVVTFAMSAHSREVHTAAFGPASYLTTLHNAIGSPSGLAQAALYPSGPPPAGPIQLSPTSHGNGFANTGGLDRDRTTPLPTSQRIDFTAPGTYHFVCLIHPFMHGTIVVK
jgi:plastocyanin